VKHAIIDNIPNNPKEILNLAKDKCFLFWVDEKGTKDNPSIFQRKLSKLLYEEAYNIINKNKPHWVISFRNQSYFNSELEDYWEFGGCNIANNDYGEVFIWIQVNLKNADEIFKKFNLNIIEY